MRRLGRRVSCCHNYIVQCSHISWFQYLVILATSSPVGLVDVAPGRPLNGSHDAVLATDSRQPQASMQVTPLQSAIVLPGDSPRQGDSLMTLMAEPEKVMPGSEVRYFAAARIGSISPTAKLRLSTLSILPLQNWRGSHKPIRGTQDPPDRRRKPPTNSARPA